MVPLQSSGERTDYLTGDIGTTGWLFAKSKVKKNKVKKSISIHLQEEIRDFEFTHSS